MEYDAVLLVSFGGPERPEEVMPFLERVTAGRGVPRSRLETVAEQYLALGGSSPINDHARALLAALDAELVLRGRSLPVVLGNRNSAPYLDDALASLAADGCRRVLAVTTSAYPSYSGCRQYRENLAAGVPPDIDIDVAMLAPYWGLDGFVAHFAVVIAEAVASLRQRYPADQVRVLSTTHSLPVAMAETSGPEGGAYVAAHLEVVARAGGGTLAYQSRSGSPRDPWLEPDVGDEIRRLAKDGARAVVLAPIGFTSDHVEVLWDLDRMAATVAADVGVELLRVATPGVAAGFVTDLARLVDSALSGEPRTGTARTLCGDGCCPDRRRPAPPAVPVPSRRTR
jgi:ferrochelatase